MKPAVGRGSSPEVNVLGGNSSSDTAGFLRFRREERLKGKDEIRDVFDKGKRFGCRGAKLFVINNNLPHNRICFTFPRGFGKAVERNHARRLCREAYRSLKPRLNSGYDMVLLTYSEGNLGLGPQRGIQENGGSTLAGRTEQLKTLFSRAGLLK